MRGTRRLSPSTAGAGHPRRAALLGLGLVMGIAGCRADGPPVTREAAAPEAAAPETPQTVQGTAAPLRPRPEPTAAQKAQLEAMQSMLRRRHFEAQTPVPLPPGLPPAIAALVPGEGVRLIEAEHHRRMRKLAPAADYRRVGLRWLSLDRGEALAAAVRAQVIAAGWAPAGSTPASPIEHPRLGTLTWRIVEPPERPSRVELVVEGPDEPGPLPTPDAVLEARPPWLDALGGQAPIGFEFGRYHWRQGGAVYTDLERFAAIFETADPEALHGRLTDALLTAGYRLDGDDPRSLRAPGAARTTFTTRATPPGALTVHFQRRWLRPKPGEAQPEGAAPAPTAPGTGDEMDR